MTFSFSPIRDESGGVGGLFHPITEVTEKMLSARRTHALRALSTSLAGANSLARIGASLSAVYDDLELDVPFLSFYELVDQSSRAVCTAASGLIRGSEDCPSEISLTAISTDVWSIAEVVAARSTRQLDDVRTRLTTTSCGPYPELPTTAMVIPVQPPGATAPVGCLLVGVSARRALDASYRAFFEQLAAIVTAAVANVLAYEQERRRVEALAEIDRAKTAFFSNVSHEFRTPLTLMLGPLEDVLEDRAEPLASGHREHIALVRSNGMRLLKLVNTLLDFSRIEAGRTRGSYEETDLAVFTRDLASVFRSTIEKAGVGLRVECESLPDPVWVDREMWEKIVLNLLSNAFKHTFVGEIVVRLHSVEDGVEFVVADTGIGIPAQELPRLFERFHRVQGARGRSYEGSGIGLALVQELVKLHGGSIRVESEVERGTRFTIRLPTGHAHLDRARLNANRTDVSTSARADTFVDEAASWIENAETKQHEVRLSIAPAATSENTKAVPRILLADDNTDMRVYVQRILRGGYAVDVVADGHAALQAARAQPPDVILSDVMMPILDGFGLLRELKANPATASIPVILLSARAGEEATLEGLAAGASDYMVKPFSARELAARVEGAIRTARVQRDVDRQRAHLEAVLAALVEGVIFHDATGTALYCNAASERLLGLSEAQLAGRTSTDARWVAIFEDGTPVPGDEHAPSVALRTGKPVVGQVFGIHRPDHTLVWLRVNAQPIFEADGALVGVATSFSDITVERQAAQAMRERSELEQQLIGIVSHDLRNPLNAIVLGSSMLLGRTELDESTRRVVTRLRNSADRATRLVRDLLDFTQARLGSGIPLTRNLHDLDLLVQHALEEMRTAFPAGDIIYQSSGSLLGMWDEDRLAQIIHNVVSNAIKYGQPGGPVRVQLEASSESARLDVHNDGEPIPAELLPDLFKPFRRGSAEGSETRSHSIGLGLFIVDQLVRAHGGTITVQSTKGSGTRFIVRLPREPASLPVRMPS